MRKTVIRSLWTKLVLVLMFFVGAGFLVAGLTQVYQINDYVDRQKEAMISDSIETISQELEEYIRAFNPNGQDTEKLRLERLKAAIKREIGHLGNANVWIVDQEGYIVLAYPEYSGRFNDMQNAIVPGITKLPTEAMELFEIELGHQGHVSGDFYGMLSKFGPEEKPGEKWDTTYTRVQGSSISPQGSYLVVISVSSKALSLAQLPIAKMFGVSFAVMVVVCLALSLLLARPMTRQITSMRIAAQKISAGDYNVELPKVSSDEIGELAESFNQMVDSLQNLENMRSQFVSNISHELRTPMTSILGFIEGILDGTIPEDQQEYYITIVRDEVRRLHKLATELMTLTKMESGSSGITKTRNNISELCRQSLISLGPLFDEKGLDIEAELGDQDMYAMCDSGMIRQVLTNILHNAIKFTPSGGMVKLSLTTVKSKIVVSIADSGQGLSQEDLKHIWDRFYKADKSRGQNADGMGLGMSITWNIIKEHGESIRAFNAENGGAVFEFTLSRE